MYDLVLNKKLPYIPKFGKMNKKLILGMKIHERTSVMNISNHSELRKFFFFKKPIKMTLAE